MKLVYALAIVVAFVVPAFADNTSCVQYCDSSLNSCDSYGSHQKAEACRADYDHCVQTCR